MLDTGYMPQLTISQCVRYPTYIAGSQVSVFLWLITNGFGLLAFKSSIIIFSLSHLKRNYKLVFSLLLSLMFWPPIVSTSFGMGLSTIDLAFLYLGVGNNWPSN